MCGGGGKEPEPYVSPQEKYRWQAGAFAKQKSNEYQQQAKEYNTELSNYQNQFNNMYSNANSVFDTVSNLDMSNTYGIDNYRKQTQKNQQTFNNLANQYSQLSRPDFQTNFNGISHGGAYLPVSASVEAPTLNAGISSYNLGNMSGVFQNTLDHLNKLDADRAAEQKRVSGFQNNLRDTLGSMTSTLSGYDIGDMDQINGLSRSLDLQKQKLSEFDSPLSNDFSFSNGLIGDMERQIGSLRDSYNTEQTRISDFQNTLNTSAQNWSDAIGGLSISDGDQIADLNNSIDDLLGQANNFQSDIATNFDLSALNSANRTIDDLQAARDAELGRISSIENNAMTTADWLNNNASTSNGYSLNNIDAMQRQLDDQRNNLANFSSDLGYDFADELSALDSSQLALDELRTRRATGIDSLFSDQSNLLSQINAIDLSNETGIRDLQSEIRRLQGQGQSYSGGRAADLNEQLGNLYGTASDKLTELYNYRGDLESQAQDLWNTNQGVDFMSLDQLSEAENQFNDLSGLVSQYNAASANDEIGQLQRLFADNRARLEGDAANVSQANQLASGEILNLLDSSGNLSAGNLPFNEYLTEAEYMALLQNEDEDENNPFLNPTFAASVGIKV